MVAEAVKRLEYLIDTIPLLLNDIDDDAFSLRYTPEKWSKKEIIGHLIDSATNNHQRFVRAQFEDKPRIDYDQNKWNVHNFYQQIDKRQIISFWEFYNRHLLELIKRIPSHSLECECYVGSKLLALDFIINDYVDHLEHHLRQVVDYK